MKNRINIWLSQLANMQDKNVRDAKVNDLQQVKSSIDNLLASISGYNDETILANRTKVEGNIKRLQEWLGGFYNEIMSKRPQ